MMKMRLKLIILIIFVFSCHAMFGQDTAACVERSLGNVYFKAKSSQLTAKAKKKLDSFVVIINRHPNCRFVVMPLQNDGCNGSALNMDRANAVLNYLLSRGLGNDRWIVNTSRMDEGKDCVDVGLRPEEDTTQLPPHPNLRRRG